MLIKILLIALAIYLIVVLRVNIRLPHPGLQAGVDVLKAANLNDRMVREMAREYIRHSDSNNKPAPEGDPYAQRLKRLTNRYVAVNEVPLNFKVYLTRDINAFATADGSIRIFSGLMDAVTDDELMAIIGHEMGHIRNNDSIGAMRKAYITSAARGVLSMAGGAIGTLTSSQLGSIGEKYASAQFSQQQEYAADDFSFGFLLRNGYDPFAMAHALEKIDNISSKGGQEAELISSLFSTHPGSAQRAARMKRRAQAHLASQLPQGK